MALRERKQWNRIIQLIIVIIFLWIGFQIVGYLGAEILWFKEVGYLPTLIKRLSWQVGLFLGTFIISCSFLIGNIFLAEKCKWQPKEAEKKSPWEEVEKVKEIPQTRKLKLSILLPIVVICSIVIGLILLYYSYIAWLIWQSDFRLPNVIPTSPFEMISIKAIWLKILQENRWKLGIVVGVAILVLGKNEWGLKAIALSISIVFGAIISGTWKVFLQYLNPTDFHQIDPQFNIDISFYVFKLPIWQLLNFWVNGMCLWAIISVGMIYLLSGNSISEGKFPGFTNGQLRHLYALVGCQMVGLAISHWLGIYELLFSKRGVNYGASYTDVNIQIPVEITLVIVAEAIALWLFWKSGTIKAKKPSQKTRKIPLTFLAFSFYLLILIGGTVTATAVQMLIVQPNELGLEKPYIERTIALTRAAFGLEDIQVETFNPQGVLNPDIIEKNHQTIENIRLWDTRPILQANRQLQQIRPYYSFPDADIDRYTLQVAKLGATNLEKRQVIMAPRELDYSAVPPGAKTWVNEHLVYTHGYGFTLSPVNQVGEGGLPFYYVKDIGTETDAGALRTANDAIRNSIPISKPRIYYGRLTNTYIMTATKVKEFDFPSGEENVYNTYDGTGGIPLGAIWRRFLFAIYLKDWKMVFTQNFTPETKVLYRRDIESRIQAIAPFLHYDSYPYLVVADTASGNNYLHWIVDAYTISDRYPYSDPGSQGFNYIRNSVKIVIDAYNGKADFYVANPYDPIIQTWEKIFPGLFKPLENMPVTLNSHIRYPVDLFSTQSERLLTYHMRDPQVFYNREDQWEIPLEIYGNQTQPIEPYYLIMKLPTNQKEGDNATENSEEFILLHPYTPTSRPNLIAWLAARSDGKEYGKLLLYQFPKQRLIYGPRQVEALINQDPVISQEISLWNRQGARAIQGNLLVIPIEGESLLYVEPVYLEAEENSLPTLVRVIVVYENRIVMATTLEKALEAIFAAQTTTTNELIIRPLEESNIIIPQVEPSPPN
ncbi:MAG: UPF0182 family protein [Gomphosphaeria aponina SAG 52.96 = DSM 107014]|uniref:UPF0182 protein DSM107014_04785 n=1 Tax=Gomphosphaeria aponina SAG 52.96 = DSM 107014 TaxID=1521640 RepID=A0A941GVW2_9CHRO|nr:UPF0182 family protein [Gomphosphaeria aponina SAG 52.96 = DSM 107014]